MKPAARVLAVVVTTAALAFTGQAVQTAGAKPHPVGAHAKGGKSDVAKSDVRKVQRDIARISKASDDCARVSPRSRSTGSSRRAKV